MLTRAVGFPITSLRVMLIADHAAVNDDYTYPNAADLEAIDKAGYKVLRKDCEILCHGQKYNAVVEVEGVPSKYYLVYIDSPKGRAVKASKSAAIGTSRWKKVIADILICLVVVLIIWWVSSPSKEKKDRSLHDSDYAEAVEILNRMPQDKSSLRQSDHADLTRAQKLLSEAVKLDPKDADAYYSLGFADSFLRNYDEAVMDLEAVVRLKPDYWKAFYALGNLYMNIALPEKAIGPYKEMVKLQPDDARGYLGLGNAYYENSRWDEASQAYTKCVEISPSDDQCRSNLDKIERRQGMASGTTGDFEKILAKNPRDVEANYRLGVSYLESGNKEMAETQVEVLKAISAKTGDQHAEEYAEKLARALGR